LRAHLRAHDNYRPYVCDFKTCNKSFTRSDELKRHKRIHNDDRNFLCPLCKKKFLRSDHLNKHLLVHNKISSGNAGHTVKQSEQPKYELKTIKKSLQLRNEAKDDQLASLSTTPINKIQLITPISLNIADKKL
jgi:uncharacterized Zn-finger protein